MNKMLLRIGGSISLLFVLFHLGMVAPIGEALANLPPDIRAAISPIVSILNVHVAFTLLIFGYLAIFRTRDLLTLRLGNILAIAISMYWLLRGINQVVFYGPSVSGLPLIAVCLAAGLLHLVPVLRVWKSVAAQPLGIPQGPKYKEQHPAEENVNLPSLPWARYAVVVWCVVFGALHLYWALGGNAGFVEFSTPSSKPLALTRDPLYMAITWGVVIACVVGAIVALVPFQEWSRRIPQWLLRTPLWIACGLFLLRGIGNPLQSALIIGGGMPFDPLPAAEMQAWNQ